jgi:hypothetical protein
MTKNNIYLPKDTLPTIEEIRYLENQEQVSTKQLSEKDFFISCPLDEGDRKAAGITGLLGMALTGAVSIVCPPAGAVIATTYATVAAGAQAASLVSDKEGVKDIAEMTSITFGIASGGAAVGAGVNKSAGLGGCVAGHKH